MFVGRGGLFEASFRENGLGRFDEDKFIFAVHRELCDWTHEMSRSVSCRTLGLLDSVGPFWISGERGWEYVLQFEGSHIRLVWCRKKKVCVVLTLRLFTCLKFSSSFLVRRASSSASLLYMYPNLHAITVPVRVACGERRMRPSIRVDFDSGARER